MLKLNNLIRLWKKQIIWNNNYKTNNKKKNRIKEMNFNSSNNKYKIKKKSNKLNWKRKKIKLDY